MNGQIDLDETKEYLLKLVPQAGDILRGYFASGKFTSESKGGVDFLTQADKEVDTFLLESIRKEYSRYPILTEETAPKDYSSLKQLDNLWIVDPLDGTVNFSRHHPNFSISVGLVDKGVSKLGVVYIPITEDLYYAQADKEGAFLNGEPIKVSSTKDLRETVLACDWSWILEQRLSVVRWLGSIVIHVRQIKSMGSAVADLASLANGRIDAYIHSGLKPWDVAASSLLIEKAGGKITTPSGRKWNVFEPEMLASNAILHKSMLDLIIATQKTPLSQSGDECVKRLQSSEGNEQNNQRFSAALVNLKTKPRAFSPRKFINK